MKYKKKLLIASMITSLSLGSLAYVGSFMSPDEVQSLIADTTF